MTWRQYAGNFDNPINPEYEQEARLVEQSRAGSERAFSALLARYQQPVFRLIFYLVGDDEEARDLTRIAIKNALLHIPAVPAGYSIRPWLLRVAVLVALDAVRERSETPQQLLASLQLPAPAAPPRIVDADPSDTDTMELGITRMETLANRPETAIADAWDTLPVDVERELIRRLLSGLPEGDAELLALGVVGQIPTRDLAALAGTSQRSIRRRIARALILFQSRYYSVRQDALPPASEAKSLPPNEAATSPIELARRGINEAGDRVMRTLQGVRVGFGSTDAQERLQTLRATDVPAAEVVTGSPPSAPRRSIPLAAPLPPRDVVDAAPTMPLPRAGDPPPGTGDETFADWTVSVPSMEVPDLATAKTPIVPPETQATEPLPRATQNMPPPAVIPMPAASAPFETQPLALADEMTIPAPMPTDAVTAPASASLSALTEPLPIIAAEPATAIRPAPEAEAVPSDVAAVAAPEAAADVTAPITAADTLPTLVRPDAVGATMPRQLPRFGPPPAEVITAVAGIAAEAVTHPVNDVAAAPTLVPANDDAPSLVPEEPSIASDAPPEIIDASEETGIAALAEDPSEHLASNLTDAAVVGEMVDSDLATGGADDAAYIPESSVAALDAPPSAIADDDAIYDDDASDHLLSMDDSSVAEGNLSSPDIVLASVPVSLSEADSEDATFAGNVTDAPVGDVAASTSAADDTVPVLANDAIPALPEQDDFVADAAPSFADAAPILMGTWEDAPAVAEDAPVAEMPPTASDDADFGDAISADDADSAVSEAEPMLATPDDAATATFSPPEAATPDVATHETLGEMEDADFPSALHVTEMLDDEATASGDAFLAGADDETTTDEAQVTPADATYIPASEAISTELSSSDDALAVEAADEAPANQDDDEAPPVIAQAEASVADSSVATAPAEAGDTIPAPPLAAIERTGDARPRQGTLNSTVVLPPLDRADYVSRHRPAWLDVGDLGSLPGVALDPDSESDAPLAKSPSVPSLGALHVSASDAPAQVGEIPPTPPEAAPVMDLADLGDLAEPSADLAEADTASAAPPTPPRAPTRPLPRLDRDIIDTPRER